MMTPPSLDLLKANHSFPGPYTFKVIVENRDGVLEQVNGLLEKAAGRALTGNKTARESTGGKHVSLTFDLVVMTAEEVHVIYAAMHTVPNVVLIL